MKFDKKKRLDVVAYGLFWTCWTLFCSAILYFHLLLVLEGEVVKARIINHIPNEKHFTNRAKNSAKFSNRHIVEIENEKYEVYLQNSYASQEAHILWIKGFEHAVLTDENGNYSFTDFFGGKWDVIFIFFGCIFIIVSYPFHMAYTYKCFRKL
jgi:hypothetical protein